MYYSVNFSRLSLALMFCLLGFPAIAQGQDNASIEFKTENSSEISLASGVISQIKITGNSQFQEEIEQIVSNYKKSRINLDRLYSLRTEISDLYVKNGFVNSGAYLPEQKIVDRIVEIVVLEGQIGQINISGANRLSENYIRSRLQGLSQPLSSDELLDRLHVLRLDPLIANISGELSAGVNPGESVLDLEVEEARGFQFSSQLNNHKSSAIGSNARILNLGHNNLLGFGDRFNATYQNTKGSNSFNSSYSLPIVPRGGSLYGGFGVSSSDIIEDAFNALDIESSSNFFTLGFDQPLLKKADRDFSLGLSFTRQHSETTLLDSPFSLSRGADEEGITNISSLRFAQDYTQRGQNQVLGLRSQFSVGLPIFDATDNKDGRPDSSYVSWVGQGQWVRSFKDDTPLILRSSLQFASDNLLPLEQFRLGGNTTVRGYRRDLALGDNGFIASGEVRLPLWQPFQGSVLQLAPFVDFGTAWNQGDEIEIEFSTLASVGMGLNFDAGNGLKARLDWGIPIIATDAEDQPITFSLGFGL